MKCWMNYALVAFGLSTRWNFGVFARDQTGSLDNQQAPVQIEHILQRRGGQKRTQKGSPKFGDQVKQNVAGSGGQMRSGGSGSRSQSMPDSPGSIGNTKLEAAKSGSGANLTPIPLSTAPLPSLQDIASSSQTPRGKKTKGQIKALTSTSSPRAPSTPSLRETTPSLQSSQEAQMASQVRPLAIVPPPRPPFTSPLPDLMASSSQQSRRRRTRAQRQRTEAGQDDSMSAASAEIARLRVTQDSGATRAPATTESIVRPPSAGIPRKAQQPAQRHIAPQPSEIEKHWGSPHLPKEPSGVHPIVTSNVPAAQGIAWLGEQSRIGKDWKKRAQAQQGTAPPQDEDTRKLLGDGVKKVQKDRSMAQVMRKLDDANFEAARIAMSRGRTGDSPVRTTVQASKDASRKAQAFTFAVSHSEGQIARTLAKHNQWEEATKHFNREHRAFSRQELRMQRGQAFDYHYVNRGVKEGLDKMARNNQTPASGTIQKAVAIRKTYKDAAVGWRKAHRDYYTVRGTFSGSSSDESETSLFDDILPPESPRSGSPRSQGEREGSPRLAGGREGSAHSGSLRTADLPPE